MTPADVFGPRASSLGPRQREFETVAAVTSKTRVADGVVAIQLARVDGQLWPGWTAGAHVDLILPDGKVRQYSLCGDPEDRERWRLGILLEKESRGGSEWIHGSLQVAGRLTVRGPRNHFQLRDHERYLFVAGGIGITPILPMIEEASRRGKPWSLHYGGRTRTGMAFLDELSRRDGDIRLYFQDEVGVLPLGDILGDPSDNVGVYACGPEPMLAAVEDMRAAWPAGSLRMERFTAAEIDVSAPGNKPIEVYLADSDVTLQVAADESILHAVRQAGVDVLSSCTEGICGTCETPVLEGIPDHRDSVLDEDERAENACMMICVSRARSSRLVLDL